jgi:hypothetical protein
MKIAFKMKMKSRVVILPLVIVFFNCPTSFGQDTTKIDTYKIDTFYLTPKQFRKTVAYEYRSITFFIKYSAFKDVIVTRLKGHNPYKKSTYEAALKKLKAELKDHDTIYFSQKEFDSVQIIPFDTFLIDQIENNKCVIRDADNKLRQTIIRMKGTKLYYPGIWGGRLFYFPTDIREFIHTTDIIS